MENLSLIDRIYMFIKTNYKTSQPFFLKDLYAQFPEINEGTIRESIRRLLNEEKILKAKNGVYELPNPDRVLKSHVVNVSNVVEQTYLKDKENNVIGYRSGINFANMLGLTSQTASVEVVYSNAVSNRKREIKLNKSRLIINAPRVEVTNKNFKLLQVLDLLTEFEKYSEYDLIQAESKLLSYISGIMLSVDELDRIVESYPLAAQVKFYKIGGANVITKR
ncbi:MAG: hypothetical protein A2Y45_06345 [Tenericutes bacterium GWC2_34_14]|nr:MAG: hypothetical protein A2Z84_00735 [Tenericutes bacterium GWA2_35_7]OHE28574.1 MAG: hypothetical protein A2Y45_06345 [Tenericutes bacterium GWC2_34_14]OHE33518.1 MAG: hypothetical protein A2012_03465 [Tenericutes bacterium GWE2_34_108]OHE36803.1 MAG: hypothetical protein A2Y46_09265 [Tenericutes bacterium GWF1_35_14]OHE38117.1 MAG: hypothetical protein A2Y44_09400 [Tenericutes bacterium GWF2_35_184]OHE42139.1 MAG: hypothetical protein A3K26_07060 [Tenericutes bacterium RIFOXYA12_FULL_35_